MKRILLLFSLFFSLSFYGQNDTIASKRSSDFVFTINGIEGWKVIKMKKEQLKNAVIRFKDKKGLSTKKVTSFEFKIPGLKTQKIIGNKIDDYTYQKILRNASKGDILTFFDIKMDEHALVRSGPMCYLSPPLLIEIY